MFQVCRRAWICHNAFHDVTARARRTYLHWCAITFVMLIFRNRLYWCCLDARKIWYVSSGKTQLVIKDCFPQSTLRDSVIFWNWVRPFSNILNMNEQFTITDRWLEQSIGRDFQPVLWVFWRWEVFMSLALFALVYRRGFQSRNLIRYKCGFIGVDKAIGLRWSKISYAMFCPRVRPIIVEATCNFSFFLTNHIATRRIPLRCNGWGALCSRFWEGRMLALQKQRALAYCDACIRRGMPDLLRQGASRL